MPVYQLGQLNAGSLAQPQVAVQIVPPKTRYINGVPTDIYGLAGVASWGPVNSATLVGSPADAQRLFGVQQVRKYDLASAIAIGFQVGAYNQRIIRVTDGTDAAATASLMDTATTPAIGATLTGFYTGSVGNSLTAAMSAGTKPNTFRCQISLPGYVPEVFDNLGVGVVPGTVTPGTGYTSVPSVAVSAPQTAGGTQATLLATLKAVSATQAAGGTGYVTNDTVTLANGVVLTVTATAGAITALAVNNPGQITAGAVPTNPQTPIATSGAGTGATINLVWGLGAPVITQSGTGYTSATATLTGGAGTGGSYTLGVACWQNLVSALNNGQSGVRGPSQLVVAAAGPSTAAPSLTTAAFTGGTDGTTGVTDATLVGTDGAGAARKGMYALRGSGVSVLNLVDLIDATQYAAINAFALAEGMYYVGQGAAGASYATISTNLNTAGVDSYAMKIMVGDWIYWQDNVNGQLRLMAPASFEAAKIASQAPHLSTLNKPIAGIVSTQRVSQNQPYSGAEIAAVVGARLDLVTNPSPGGNYYAAQTGRNVSSNPATNGDNYTRMTNYLAFTLAAAFGWVIGQLQTTDLRTTAKAAMVSFLSNLEQQGMIGDVNGGPAFSVQIDSNNNPASRVALGYLQADVQVKYLSVVFDFLINLEGGQSVVVQTKQ